MGTSHHSGFTIIETMLFLAVTGVLIAGLLVGVGTSLNIQRYRDSVTSLKSFLQSQYSAVNNVENDRDGTWSCSSTAVTTQSGAAQNPGQSNCVIIGRLVIINGGSTTVVPVTAYSSGSSTGNGDIADLKANYTLGISQVGEQTDSLAWGTVIAWPVSGAGSQNPTTPRSIAIFIVRSPETGSVYTFTEDSPPSVTTLLDSDNSNPGAVNKYLQGMLVTGVGPTPSQLQRTICVDSQGLVAPSLTMAVYLHAYATDENSVETRSNDVIKSLGGDTQC